MATCRPIIPWPEFIHTDESGTPNTNVDVQVNGICVLPGGRGCIVEVMDYRHGRYLLQISMDGEIEVLADDDNDSGVGDNSSVSIMSDGFTLLVVTDKGPL